MILVPILMCPLVTTELVIYSCGIIVITENMLSFLLPTIVRSKTFNFIQKKRIKRAIKFYRDQNYILMELYL